MHNGCTPFENCCVEASAADNVGIFHVHAPKASERAEEEPVWAGESRGPDAEQQAQAEAMVQDEAKAAENAGIFHPHAPSKSARDDDYSEQPAPAFAAPVGGAAAKYVVEPKACAPPGNAGEAKAKKSGFCLLL